MPEKRDRIPAKLHKEVVLTSAQRMGVFAVVMIEAVVLAGCVYQLAIGKPLAAMLLFAMYAFLTTSYTFSCGNARQMYLQDIAKPHRIRWLYKAYRFAYMVVFASFLLFLVAYWGYENSNSQRMDDE